MALINHIKQEINAKIVYFGPGMAGKETNLQQVFSQLQEKERGKPKLMELHDARMLFFDILSASADSAPSSYSLRYHLYTLLDDGSSTSWRMVLKGVDGIVFVADSDPARMEANSDSIRQLKELLEEVGRSLREIPMVIQLNKRDLPGASPVGDMIGMLNADTFRTVSAVARSGEGVVDTLGTLLKLIQIDLRQQGLNVTDSTGMFEKKISDIFGSGQGPSPAGVPIGAPEEVKTAHLETHGQTVLGHVVELGEPLLENGVVRLPLTVTCGDRYQRFTVTVSVSLDG
ncbi:ATP/GTP-binding protein [Geobacter sp. DSM 9736]|uniref:GTP-binding protein n=1 Tax=Geobacter sp. DSM 9736 TaxID=1277350 RepID=UPI000B509D5D|nr:ADP-ribosylation factor-like protein [Geobacter sp. DSM 9736]SNB45728.1 Signal recognition particle receptor subunit beta, a GTPase [Geobacter sp. DSM 9736]